MKNTNLLNLIPNDELTANILLYKYPLFKHYSDDGNIHLLLLGGDAFIKHILLAALSTGQMGNAKLFLHVVTRDAEEFKNNLLLQAPTLKEYADFGENDKANENAYVTFSFEKVVNLNNERNIRKIAKKYSFCRYTVISSDNCDDNKIIAEMLAENVAEFSDNSSLILYFDPKAAKNDLAGSKCGNIVLIPFNTSRKLYEKEISELGLQAFRVYYLYVKQYNPRASKERSLYKFSENLYDQKSSLETAVHVDYKLASLDLKISDIETSHRSQQEHQTKVIEKYNKCLKDDAQFHYLVSLEHRRWMMSKIAEGYRAPTLSDLEQYAFKNFNGKFNASFKCTAPGFKFHHCLVPSSPNTKRLPDNRDEWDKYQSAEEILATEFDRLDQMSLTVHFFAKQKIERRTTQNRIKQILNDIEELLLYLPDNGDLIERFEAFSSFVKQILVHKSTQGLAPQIRSIKTRFENRGVKASYLLELLENEFAIFTEFSAYKDYKESDETIIKNLLWIKYSRNICLIKEPTENIAYDITIPLIIEPDTIVFAGGTPNKNIEEFFSSHGNNSKICYESCHYDEVDKLIRKLESITNKYKFNNIVIDITGTTSLFTAAAIILAKKNKKIGVVSWRASDSELMNIINFPQCSIYRLNTYLSAGECFELHGAKPRSELNSYMQNIDPYIDKLWSFYLKYKNDWEMISSFFSVFGRRNSILSIRGLIIDDSCQWKRYSQSWPSSIIFSSDILKCLDDLKEQQILRNISLSEGEGYSTLNFDYPLTAGTEEFVKNFNYMLTQIGNKKLTCNISRNVSSGVDVNFGSNISVSFSTDKVFEDKEIRKSFEIEKMLRPLEDLRQMNLLSALKIETKWERTRIEFTYSSTSIRDCLSKAGNILEAKVWCCAAETGYFDSIQSNFCFKWSNQAVSNELDVVLTKGLKTLVCSCKTAKYCKEHLYEIESLARKFSVNSIPVIIYSSDKSVENGKISHSTQAVVDRAREMGVHLIDENTINTNLGEALIRIANL